MSGHFYRTCKHFNKKYSLEQNQRYYQKKHKGDTTTEDTKAPEGGRSGGTNPPRPGGSNSRRVGGSNGSGGSNRGRSNPPNARAEDSSEQSRVALEINTENIIDAGLADEEFSLICKCEDDVIDLLLDTGTVSNIVPEDRRDSVQDIRDEHTSLIGVGGARVTARETGEAGVFGRSRIVPGTGAICISQRQFGDKFQMINPHKDLVILRGWPKTKYANREYHFTRDSGDQLLHCKLRATSEMAMVAKYPNFYRPAELPNLEDKILSEPRRYSRLEEYTSTTITLV